MSIPVVRVSNVDRREFASSSKGDQHKWKVGDLWLKADKFGYEGLAEWVCYELISRSNLPDELIVPYGMCKIIDEDGIEYNGCYSKDFLRPRERLVTLDRLLTANNLSLKEMSRDKSTQDLILHIAHLVGSITNLEVYDYLVNQLTFDAVVLNEDRHTNNIAFIKGEYGYRLCPYFDHGLSLLSDVKDYPDTTPLHVAMRKVKAKPFSANFGKQALAKDLRFDRKSVMQFLEDNNLGRVARVLRVQIHYYSHLFV